MPTLGVHAVDDPLASLRRREGDARANPRLALGACRARRPSSSTMTSGPSRRSLPFSFQRVRCRRKAASALFGHPQLGS